MTFKIFTRIKKIIGIYINDDKHGTNKLEKLGTATIMESRNPTIVRILEEKGSVIENRYSRIPTMKRK